MLLQAIKISIHFLIVSHTLKFRLYIPFYVAILSTPLALAYSKDLPHENTVTLTKTATFFALMCMQPVLGISIFLSTASTAILKKF